MVLQIVAEAALSTLFQGLFDKLALPFIKSFVSLRGVEDEVNKLSRRLSEIQAVLNDAEERQITDESVKLWLRDLKDVAYDAEDVVDEFTTEALRSKAESGIHTRKRKLDQVFDSFTSFNSNRNLAQRIMEISKRLDEIAKQRHDLRLKEGDGRKRNEMELRRETSSIISEPCVFGRDGDAEKIIEMLEVDESSENDISVVPIVGMGGLGKTTLAQLVYNDNKVEKLFDLRAWVCVSEDFDVRRLTKAILESATGTPYHFNDLDPLQVRLKERLSGKRFLLVLDDVWNEKRGDWEALRAPLKFGSKGSRIVVTTRSKKVSSIMGTVPAHNLGDLSDGDCWSLFKHYAFENGNSDLFPRLEEVGKEIVKKCKGLPLAAKTLGGLLHGITDENEWNYVWKSDIWNLPDDGNHILPALRLSYHHLPAKLKQCFAYCSIFPKDFQFQQDRLVMWWMAEGFIQSKEGRRMEDVGNEYFEDLLSRSFFQSAGIFGFKMHDLALTISGDDCYRVERGKPINIPRKVRHLSFLFDDKDGKLPCFKAVDRAKSLRTFVIVDTPSRINQIPHDVFLNLRCLRVLHLSYTGLKELPDSIGYLQHLRYLNLYSLSIEKLPESISGLFNLQTLELGACNSLQGLPRKTCNLINLRHLNVPHEMDSMPPDIGTLNCLQTLSTFPVGKESRCGIGQLKDLIYLRGHLSISNMENVVDVEEAKDASLKNKEHLDELSLEWKWNGVHVDSIHGVALDVIEALQPHTNLKNLTIKNYCGDSFPSWIGDSSLSNLVCVELYDCEKCRFLPPLGQLPFLKDLSISRMHCVKYVGREFYGVGLVKGFPSLENVHLYDMPELEEWVGAEEGEFPCLRFLYVQNCCKLRVLSLPRLPSLCDLEVWRCNQVILNALPCLTSLNYIVISDFNEPKPLQRGWLQHFATLKKLELNGCSEITSFLEDSGLQELPSLEHLQFSYCKQLTSLPKGLQKLSSLQNLKIHSSDELTSLLETELPTSLKHLRIERCRNLLLLPKVLHNLTSLTTLRIWDNPQLESLPEGGLPTSLQNLDINYCPKLQHRCRKEGGEDWLKIAHIPKVFGLLDTST